MIPSIVYNVLILFLMMIPGVIMKKRRLAPEGFGKGLSNMVLYIAQPALVFLAYVREFSMEILINSLWIVLFAALSHLIFAVVSLSLFNRAEDAKRRMLRMATIFSNAAFMGIPLIGAVLGDDALIYASMYNIVFNLFLWSLGVNICTADKKEVDTIGIEKHEIVIKSEHKSSFIKAILHPVTIAAALGLVFFFTPANRFLGDSSYIGGIIADAFSMLKALVAPLSMIVIGIRLADIDFKGFFSDKYLYLFLALRHFILPIAVGFLVRLLMLAPLGITADVLNVVVILACAPAASSATMFAEMYDCDSAYVSKLVAVSTILCILTMPAVIFLTTIGL